MTVLQIRPQTPFQDVQDIIASVGFVACLSSRSGVGLMVARWNANGPVTLSEAGQAGQHEVSIIRTENLQTHVLIPEGYEPDWAECGVIGALAVNAASNHKQCNIHFISKLPGTK
jgi:hypothetical protein